MRFLDASAYPADEVKTLQITLPGETVDAIDEALGVLIPRLRNREHFVKLAVRYALASLHEDSEALRLGLEE